MCVYVMFKTCVCRACRVRSSSSSSSLIDARLGRDDVHLGVERVVVHGSVINLYFTVFDVRERMFHPRVVETVGEVFARVRAATLLAALGRVHGGLRVGHEVVELERLYQVGVPNQRSVGELEVV